MKKIIVILIILSAILLVGCDWDTESEADKAQRKATDASMAEALAQTGMPAIENFTELKLMKMLLELRDQADLICYAYSYSDYTGKYTFLGKCIGYGLPYSVQYTNPMKKLGGASAGELTTIPQPDPNGLYMPDGLSATFVMLIYEETGEPYPFYMEPSLAVWQRPLPARICMDGINQ